MCSKNMARCAIQGEYVTRCGPRTCGKMWHKNVARCSTRRKCGNMWHKNPSQLRPGCPVVSFDNLNQEKWRYLNHFNLLFIIRSSPHKNSKSSNNGVIFTKYPFIYLEVILRARINLTTKTKPIPPLQVNAKDVVGQSARDYNGKGQCRLLIT